MITKIIKDSVIFFIVATLAIVGCQSKNVSSKTSGSHLYARAWHDLDDDEIELSLSLALDEPVLVRDIVMKTGDRKWYIDKPSTNNVLSAVFIESGVKELIDIEFTSDSLSIQKPDIDDYPDTYGHDWTAYRKDSEKYEREYERIKKDIWEKFIIALKADEPLTFEIRGKLKNMSFTIPKVDVENIIKVYDIHSQM